jgi:undecaprenyl-diphosphatase
LWLTATLVGNAVVVFFLKGIVRRIRPCFALSDVHARVFEAPSDYSFPSGHAAGSFAFAMFVGVVLLRYARTKGRYTKRSFALAAFVLLLAFGVAVSRCALGVHFPSDVLAGAMIGATAGLLGAKQHARG